MQDRNHDLLDECEAFLRDYYKEPIARIAQKPRENPSLWIDYGDLFKFNPDLADDMREFPDEILSHLEEAIDMVDIPLDMDLSDVGVRVTGLDDEYVHTPSEIRKEHGEWYVGISGTLERVTSTSDMPDVLAFECTRCGTVTRVPQSLESGELQEPYQCDGCERDGPFTIVDQKSEWSDYAKLRIEETPGATDADAGKMTGYVLDDLIDYGGDQGLIGRAGEPVTVYGIVRRVQKSGRGENSLLFDHILDVRAVEFDRDEETVDIQAHRETFEELADEPDAVDLFAQSIAPNLYQTDAWEVAMEFAVAYLFGAPRIDLDNGPTYRGDLHFLIVSDYGMGKSDFASDVEAYSPKSISKSTTALSSDVGLTAAAVKDDFGEGAWTIKPGLLVKANEGHLILDEIDKGPDDLTDMNDALEGKQQVDVEKAGMSATYDSRTAVMALGNPVDGSFEPHEPIPDQLGIKESLLSRFDGIVTMEDEADVTTDKKIAETYGKAYTEAQQAEHGDGETTMDVLDRPVPIDVGRAWIKYARENVHPVITYEQFKELESWYAEEVRQLNHQKDAQESMPVPATVRKLASAVKMSLAFARVHLREEVTDADIDRAKKLGKQLVKNNWDGEKFDASKHSRRLWTQADRRDWIIEQTNDDAVDTETLIDRATGRGMDRKKVENDIDSLKERGELYEPSIGEVTAT